MKFMTKIQLKEQFLNVFKDSYGIISSSCDKCNISRSTFYRWCSEDSKFAEKVKEINEGVIDRVEAHLLKKIFEGDTTSIIFFLKTRAKNRGFSERIENVVTGNLDQDVKFQFVTVDAVKAWLNTPDEKAKTLKNAVPAKEPVAEHDPIERIDIAMPPLEIVETVDSNPDVWTETTKDGRTIYNKRLANGDIITRMDKPWQS